MTEFVLRTLAITVFILAGKLIIWAWRRRRAGQSISDQKPRLSQGLDAAEPASSLIEEVVMLRVDSATGGWYRELGQYEGLGAYGDISGWAQRIPRPEIFKMGETPIVSFPAIEAERIMLQGMETVIEAPVEIEEVVMFPEKRRFLELD